MTYSVQSLPADSEALPPASEPGAALRHWQDVRDDSDLQFEQIAIPEYQPPEPNWFERAVTAFFEWLGDVLSPVGAALAYAWPVLQWVLLGLVIAMVIYMAMNTLGPLARRRRERGAPLEEPGWTPSRSESLALLEDADRLADEGRYDEATHLLLQRSVGQIAAAQPGWVEPSSTARELAALPALSQAARSAFAIISERVERSLFALRALDRQDWETARAAYADFALVRIEEA